MFLIRAVEEKDLEDLYDLSCSVTFINLPPNREIIQHKISKSIKSFKGLNKNIFDGLYLFVLEDRELDKVIGASMIHAQHGTEVEPHFYLSVGREHKYSKTLNTGFIHGTLKLDYETDGPTEIGGLILREDYRSHKEKLGKLLSFVRFLYIGLHLDYFKEVVHSELMPPLDQKGNSPLWEAIGRRFLNMDYQDADILSRTNKEFILSLYPSETIYETLLPIEARNSIGEVGKDTLPVKKMLESIGFKYAEEVDPFDGGPHYRCLTKDILPIKNMIHGIIDTKSNFDPEQSRTILAKIDNGQNLFQAYKMNVNIVNDRDLLKIVPEQKFLVDLDINDTIKISAIYL